MIKARVIIILIIIAIEDESIVVIDFFLFISYSMINVDKLCTFSVNYIFFNCNPVFLRIEKWIWNIHMKYIYIYSIVNGIMKVVKYKEEVYMYLEQLFVILFIGFPLFLQIMVEE